MLQLDQDCKGKFTGEREEPVERAGQETRHPVVQRRVGGNRARMVVLQVLENMSSNQIKHQNDFSPSCPFDSINGYSWCLGLVFCFFVCLPVSKMSLAFRGFHMFFGYGE